MKLLKTFFLLTFLLLPSFVSADTTISSNITSNQTWTTASSTFIIDGAITVNSGVTLTINPGVIVKFKTTSSSLNISGTLNALGSSSSPIYFTSYKDDSVGGDTNSNGSATSPAAGDWLYLYPQYASTANLDHVVVRYGGNNTSLGAIYNYYGILSLTNSEVATSSGYGVYSTVSSVDIASTTFRGNTNAAARLYLSTGNPFTHHANFAIGNGKNGFVVSGSLATSSRWGADVPIIISSDNLTVGSGKTLTLDPNAIVKFEGATTVIYVYGTLNVAGTALQPVFLTSMKDDWVGGDTNNDGAASSPAAGDWDRISYYSGSGNVDYAIVRYGGSNAAVSTLHNSNGTLTLTNSEVAYSKYRALQNDGGTLTVASTTLLANAYGLYHGNGTTNIGNRGNIIASSSSYGIYNNTGTSLNAESVYWVATTTGATSMGPYHPTTNPSGNGPTVSNNVNFTPWITPVSGTIATNTTWTASSTYIVDGAVTINSGVTLTIKEGVVVKFKDAASSLNINGTLNADASASSSKIYFTSYKDDAVGGDTNLDGSATSPTAGDWDGIKINSGAATTMNNIVVRYGGYTGSGGSSKMIWNNGGTLKIYSSEIASSGLYGIYHAYSSAELQVLASDIHNNSYGIFINDSSIVSVYSNNIHNNFSYGIDDDTILGVDVRYNYWGASNGPSGAGNGSGDAIDGGIFTKFNPWLEQVRYLFFFNGSLITAVTNRVIDWNWYNAPSIYTTAWYAGMNTWNTYGNSVGGVSIATSTTATSSADLLVLDIASSSSDYFLGQYDPNPVPDLLKFNPYYMNQYGDDVKKNTVIHELGHAFGLWHSYLGNIMNSYATGSTTLGVQDKSDYSYCWVTNNCGQ